MRKTLLLSAALIVAGMASGHAQTSATQTPPSPGASSQTVQPSNSLPPGANTGANTLAPGMRGIRPTAGPLNAAPADTMASPPSGSADSAAPAPRRRMAMPAHHYRGHRAMRAARENPAVDPENPGGGQAPADQYTGVPPTNAYQGGAGSPYSTRATHIDRADTRSVIAPRLPNPDASGNSPQSFLMAAQRALSRNQTGAAQEALERAQTRILTRSTDPSMANVPDNSGMAQAIGDARRALANGDTARARSIIGQALNTPG